MEDLEARLLRLSVDERFALFAFADIHLRDRTFLAHMRQMNVQTDEGVRYQCLILHGFNNQPGLREQVDRWFHQYEVARVQASNAAASSPKR